MLVINPVRVSCRFLSGFQLYRRCLGNNSYNFHFKELRILKTPITAMFSLENSQFLNFHSSNSNLCHNKPDSPEKSESAVLDSPPSKVSQKVRLKQAVRDYGATIVVFHVAISLASLGLSYLVISSGVDAVRLLTFIGFSEALVSSKVAVGGSTFVIAYAVHKLFAPVRIATTLSVAPFIVRYLRKINWLKPPKNKT